ncbi:hypothetical protein C2S51_026880, partial [Perilla frutescens var. frutescens]
DGDQVYFNVKRNAKVINLLRSYCHTKQLDYKTVNFFHNGVRLRRRGTAQQ